MSKSRVRGQVGIIKPHAEGDLSLPPITVSIKLSQSKQDGSKQCWGRCVGRDRDERPGVYTAPITQFGGGTMGERHLVVFRTTELCVCVCVSTVFVYTPVCPLSVLIAELAGGSVRRL